MQRWPVVASAAAQRVAAVAPVQGKERGEDDCFSSDAPECLSNSFINPSRRRDGRMPGMPMATTASLTPVA